MDNAALKNSGPGSIADRARAGADVAGDLTDAMLIDSGPSSTADKARMGAALAEDGTFSDLSVKVTDADGEEDQLPTFTLVVAAA